MFSKFIVPNYETKTLNNHHVRWLVTVPTKKPPSVVVYLDIYNQVVSARAYLPISCLFLWPVMLMCLLQSYHTGCVCSCSYTVQKNPCRVEKLKQSSHRLCKRFSLCTFEKDSVVFGISFTFFHNFFLCRVCMLNLCTCEFSPSTLVSPTSKKTCLLGEPISLNWP